MDHLAQERAFVPESGGEVWGAWRPVNPILLLFDFTPLPSSHPSQCACQGSGYLFLTLSGFEERATERSGREFQVICWYPVSGPQPSAELERACRTERHARLLVFLIEFPSYCKDAMTPTRAPIPQTGQEKLRSSLTHRLSSPGLRCSQSAARSFR